MTHTALDIFLYALMAGGVGFLVGHAWPGRMTFLSRQSRQTLATDTLPEFPLAPLPGLLPGFGGADSSSSQSEPEGARGGAATRGELAKWQQRASRLATALRERDAALRDRDATIERLEHSAEALRKLRKEDPGTAGSRVRDELIGELEVLLHNENARYREVLAERDAGAAEAAQLAEQLAVWKQKWRDAANVLDQRDATVAERDRACQELQQSLDTVRAEKRRYQVTADAASARVEELEQHGRIAEQALQAKLDEATVTAGDQQRLNTELMQSLEERRHRILDLETELAALADEAAAAQVAADQAAARADQLDAQMASMARSEPADPGRPVVESRPDDAPEAFAPRPTQEPGPAREFAPVHEPAPVHEAHAMHGAEPVGGPAHQTNPAHDTVLAAVPPWPGGAERDDGTPADPPSPPSNLLDHPPLHVDDLTRLRGIGAKLERRLNGLGIYQYDQIAAFDRDDVAWIEGQLAGCRGRIERDQWLEQAAALAAEPSEDAEAMQGPPDGAQRAEAGVRPF